MKFEYKENLEDNAEINLDDLYKSIDNLNLSDEEKLDLYFHIEEFFDEPKITVINEKSITLRENNEKIIDDYEKQCQNILEKQSLEAKNKVCKIQNFSELKQVNNMFKSLRQEEYGKDYGYYCFMGLRGIGNECHIVKEDNQIKIKTLESNMIFNSFYTKFGLMICENRGEWGGNLYNFTEYGHELIDSRNYRHVFEYDDKVYAIAGLSHLASHRCSLHEIRKYPDKFENITLFESDNVNFYAFYVEDNYIYFYPVWSIEGGLYRFNLDNYQFEVINENLCEDIDVNSLVKKDNFIYLYGNYNVVKYDLETEELEIYTNLDYNQIDDSYYIHDMKLLDIWDKLLDV